MPVQVTWESQDAIPEPFREHVIERDGKFIFEAETASEIGNLKKTLDKERKSRTSFEQQLKKFEKFAPLVDADEEEVSEFLESFTKRVKGGKPDDKHLDLKFHEKTIAKKDAEIAKTRADYEQAQHELRDFRLWTPLRDIAIKAGLVAEDWELARLELNNKKQFDFDEDGKIVVLEDGQASSVTPENFFKQIYSEQRPKFYRATGAGGSGAQAGANNSSGGKTMKRSAFDQLGSDQKMKRIKEGYAVVD